MFNILRTSGGGAPKISSLISEWFPWRKPVDMSPELNWNFRRAHWVSNMFLPKVDKVGLSLGKYVKRGSWNPLMINLAFAFRPSWTPESLSKGFQICTHLICITLLGSIPLEEQIWTASWETNESTSFFMACSNSTCSSWWSLRIHTSAFFLTLELTTQALPFLWTSRGAMCSSNSTTSNLLT